MARKLNLTTSRLTWPLREPFVTARGAEMVMEALLVVLNDDAGRTGRGEACPVYYAGETVEGAAAQVDSLRAWAEAGELDRGSLLGWLPAGAARCAVDAALWDLEAKSEGQTPFAAAGVRPAPVVSAMTIGIRAPEAYREAARQYAHFSILKIKVDGRDPLTAIAAAREGAPQAAFIVDPNQAWSVAQLQALAQPMADLGVVLFEQPIPIGVEEGLSGYQGPVKLCADELIDDLPDLDRADGLFEVVNIKLEKCGGLTQALRLAAAAASRGFELMVGTMGGSSLAMAPGLVLAQRCRWVDLDGPLLLAEDWPQALTYDDGVVQPPNRALWG